MEIKLTKTTKKITREKCGDCYYNGDCSINLKTCPYLNKSKVMEE